MSIHTPERGATESQAEYRERRSASRIAVERMTLAGIPNTNHSTRRNGRGAPGAYGRGLRNAITAKTKTDPGLYDENGAVTLTGRPRRIWLAGISAQRGY